MRVNSEDFLLYICASFCQVTEDVLSLVLAYLDFSEWPMLCCTKQLGLFNFMAVLEFIAKVEIIQ